MTYRYPPYNGAKTDSITIVVDRCIRSQGRSLANSYFKKEAFMWQRIDLWLYEHVLHVDDKRGLLPHR